MDHKIAGVQAVKGDAVGLANLLLPSYQYEATTRAGQGGATLGLLRASQFSSLIAQVYMSEVGQTLKPALPEST